jgi:hypothetical protein
MMQAARILNEIDAFVHDGNVLKAADHAEMLVKREVDYGSISPDQIMDFDKGHYVDCAKNAFEPSFVSIEQWGEAVFKRVMKTITDR